MTDYSPELQYLLDQVSATFGGRLETTTDFDSLSYAIENSVHQHISSSTLKRLWGYVQPRPRPRTATLDVLAQYARRSDYRSLCKELHESSDFISTEKLESGALKPGDRFVIRWLPDRSVMLECLGDKCFKVIDQGRSKLRSGDVFHASVFLKNHPLYIDDLTRDGSVLQPYVAGRSTGLTAIERIK